MFIENSGAVIPFILFQDAPVKLCDFGFAKIDQGDLMTPQFTPYYVAPQVSMFCFYHWLCHQAACALTFLLYSTSRHALQMGGGILSFRKLQAA